jgi:hypothetical protein
MQPSWILRAAGFHPSRFFEAEAAQRSVGAHELPAMPRFGALRPEGKAVRWSHLRNRTAKVDSMAETGSSVPRRLHRIWQHRIERIEASRWRQWQLAFRQRRECDIVL